MLDPYAILGLNATATEDDIRAAYRKRAAQIHPDIQPADRRARAEEDMKRLNEARDMLLDPERRAAYDARFRKRSAPRPGVYADAPFYPRQPQRPWNLPAPWNALALYFAFSALGLAVLLAPAAVAMLIQIVSVAITLVAFLGSWVAIVVVPLLIAIGLAFVAFIATTSLRNP